MQLSEEQVQDIKELHRENADMLLKIVGGEVDPDDPKPITLEDASCLIARVIDNNTEILKIINQAERL